MDKSTDERRFVPTLEHWKGPSHQLFIRSNKGTNLYYGPPAEVKIDESFTDTQSSESIIFSNCGTFYAILRPNNIVIYKIEDSQVSVIQKLSGSDFKFVGFSPLSNYLLTWSRVVATDEELVTNGVKGNFLVWDLKSGLAVKGLLIKTFSRDLWPMVKFTADESVCGLLVHNGVHLYKKEQNSMDFSNVWKKVNLENITKFEFSPPGNTIAVASVEKKGSPANVQIVDFNENEPKVLSHRSFHKATSINLLWSSKGTALIAVSHTDVDSSGHSYYGETGIHFIKDNGETQSLDLGLKPGPIHDVQWSPIGNQFVVVYGSSPSQATIFDINCNKKADFPHQHRNVAKWSPNGHILMLGGFGSMTGRMEFWDVKRLAKVGVVKAPDSAPIGFSPCSNFFITAIIFSKLRVDNGFKIWHWSGVVVYETKFEELYSIQWRPYPVNRFPNFPPPKPASVVWSDKEKIIKSETSNSSSGGMAKSGATGKYVPPSRRGAANSNTIVGSDLIKASANSSVEEEKAKKYTLAGGNSPSNKQPKPVQHVIPGLTPTSPTGQSKPKKKRSRKKKSDSNLAAESHEESKKEAEEPSSDSSAAPADESFNVEKKIKNLQKKLRQINQLKEDEKNGKVLNSAQKEKIGGESQIQNEINQLKESAPK